MRDFVLFSRKGWTAGDFPSMLDGGRLDTVYQCALTALFMSHRIRRDVGYHAVLNGPPDPPMHLHVDGATLRDVRVDERTWEAVLRSVLSGGTHPGVSVRKAPFQEVVSGLAARPDTALFVLEERGTPIEEAVLSPNNVFVLGDHVGLPRAEERYALRFGEKVSIGRARYLSASVIDILNHTMDRAGR